MTGPACKKCGEPWLDEGHVCNALRVRELEAEVARLKGREHDETVRVYGVALQKAEAERDAMLDVIEAAKDVRNSPISYTARDYDERQVSHADVEAFDAALARLEGMKYE